MVGCVSVNSFFLSRLSLPDKSHMGKNREIYKTTTKWCSLGFTGCGSLCTVLLDVKRSNKNGKEFGDWRSIRAESLKDFIWCVCSV